MENRVITDEGMQQEILCSFLFGSSSRKDPIMKMHTKLTDNIIGGGNQY